MKHTSGIKVMLIKSLILLLFYCNLSNVLSANTPLKGQRIRMGFYGPSLNDYVAKKDIEISMKFWVHELIEGTGLDVTGIELYDSIHDLQAAFDNREIDMFSAPPLEIVKHFKRENLADGFFGIREGGELNSLLLLARSDRVSTLQDVRNKRLIIPRDDGLAIVFLETLMLKKFRKSYINLFSDIQSRKKLNRIILDLFFDKADVALVYQSAFDVMTELNPQIHNQINVLATYPVQSRNFSYFHKDYSAREFLIDKALHFAEYPRGRQILDIYQTAELGVCKIEFLNPFAKLYKQYKKLQRSIKQ